ncbi:MAG: DUF5618 family protein [Elusimicrobiota bacterium]
MKNKKLITQEEYFKEAVRYYKNAKNLLKQTKVEYNRYQDLKHVRESASTCYLSVLFAINGYLIKRGIPADRIPTSITQYWELLNKNLVHNGKIKSAFQTVYEILHITGYYRGTGDVNAIKGGFEKAKLVIETLTGEKIK